MIDEEGGIGNADEGKNTDSPVVDAEEKQYPERNVDETISFGNRALAGEFPQNLEDYQTVAATGETQQGPPDDEDLVVDPNNYSMADRERILEWVSGKLGNSIENAPIQNTFRHPDDTVEFRVFEKVFGSSENPWYIVQVLTVNEDGEVEDPIYMFRSAAMIEEDMLTFQEMRGLIKKESTGENDN